VVDWRESGIQIIASIIASGLIVGILTGIMTEINRPNIKISIDDISNHTTETQTFINTFTNIGNSPASNVRLTMNYPGLKIINYDVEQTSENLSLTFSKENPNTLAAYIPRFTNGAIITINITIDGIVPKEKAYDPDPYSGAGNQSFSIIATYDEGIDRYNIGINNYRINAYNVFFIYAIIAVAAFTIALKYKKISELIGKRINKSNQSKFVFQIYQDIITVKSNFTKDHQSVKYIPTEKWKSCHQN
jgi:hypothetical protein